MTVEKGTVFGFLGPNGAGKTTTLRILSGLARPTSGTVSVAGIDPASDGRSLSSHIGFLPEEPAFYPWMTPAEFLKYLAELHHLPAESQAARINELLELVTLAEVRKRRIGGFSRGMRQRLGLAAALLHKPAVLLLDEPVSALDPVGRKEMLDLIEGLRGTCTVLMSSHILADVERVCSVVGIIARGKLIVQADRETLMNRYAQPVFQCEGLEPATISRWAEKLKSEVWVSALNQEGSSLRVTTTDPERARGELLRSAVAENIPLRRFEEARPSLEDIFLQLVEKEEAV
jgi:ABC-2 type transport system ATP-binding protein